MNKMNDDNLIAACGLYCGFCRIYMNNGCQGCGTKPGSKCKIYECCRIKRGLTFCTECKEFLCDTI